MELYNRSLKIDPSKKLRNAWTFVPQNQRLEVSGHKTSSMYGEPSSLIPLFYLLTFLAIAFDIYLGFSVLLKSGVDFYLVFASVLFDVFLAILVYLMANFLKSNTFNGTYLDNLIFKTKLERITRKIDENEDEYNERKAVLSNSLSSYNSSKTKLKIFKLIMALLIIAIAYWKIYTYKSVLPPGMSLFTLVKGKVVIIFAILTAIFHIMATEKSLASFWFGRLLKKEINQHIDENAESDNREPKSLKIDYVGKYRPAKFGNTRLEVDEKGRATIYYYNIIWDDEIKHIMEQQGDENAKRGFAIKCKENQLY